MNEGLMRNEGSLEWWETPLSGRGYKNFFITDGAWLNDKFLVHIDCSRDDTPQVWDRWLCSITKAVWVRVIADEFYEVARGDNPGIPSGPFRAPLYRVVGSKDFSKYERFLTDARILQGDLSLKKYLIASMKNEIHFLAMTDPTFQLLKPRAY